MVQKIEQLDNVSLKLKANIYFEGGVISHTVINAKAERQTIGIIRPGTYHFSTDAAEKMDILSGQCKVKLAGESDWKTYRSGDTFHIQAKSSFDIAVDGGHAEYLCTFANA